MHIKICMQKYQLSTSRIQVIKNAITYAKDHNNHSEVFIAKKMSTTETGTGYGIFFAQNIFMLISFHLLLCI